MISVSNNIPRFLNLIVNYLLIRINIAVSFWELKLDISG